MSSILNIKKIHKCARTFFLCLNTVPIKLLLLTHESKLFVNGIFDTQGQICLFIKRFANGRRKQFQFY